MIIKAIQRAYLTAAERNWNSIYWAIDLHGVCFPYSYGRGSYKFLGPHVVRGLQTISSRPESKIILWSACHEDEQPDIIKHFVDHGINVHYFNENPEIPNTHTGNFDDKFYFSIVLDDKAGFNPDEDWDNIIWHFENDYVPQLRKWEDIKRASPTPLTDAQYEKFLRGEDPT